jgi:hypothetical protein
MPGTHELPALRSLALSRASWLQLSKYLREVALSHVSKSQLFIRAFAKALEVSKPPLPFYSTQKRHLGEQARGMR